MNLRLIHTCTKNWQCSSSVGGQNLCPTSSITNNKLSSQVPRAIKSPKTQGKKYSTEPNTWNWFNVSTSSLNGHWCCPNVQRLVCLIKWFQQLESSWRWQAEAQSRSPSITLWNYSVPSLICLTESPSKSTLRSLIVQISRYFRMLILYKTIISSANMPANFSLDYLFLK